MLVYMCTPACTRARIRTHPHTCVSLNGTLATHCICRHTWHTGLVSIARRVRAYSQRRHRKTTFSTAKPAGQYPHTHPTHARMLARLRAHARTHVRTHARTHAPGPSSRAALSMASSNCREMCAHSQSCTPQANARKCARTHARTPAPMHPCTHARMCAPTPVHPRTRARTRMHTCTHARIHTGAIAHSYTHMHTRACSGVRSTI